MEDYERSKKEALDVQKSIQSLDDLKEKKDLMIDTQEKFVVTAVETVKKFFEDQETLSPEEKQKQVERFSDEQFIFDEEFDREMERIYSLPGCEEYMATIDPEIEQRLTPPMNEFMEIMKTKMMEIMAPMMDVVEGTMGAMAEGIGMVAEGMQEMVEEPEEDYYEPSSEVKDLTYQLPHYLRLHTIDDLKNEKDDMLEYINELIGQKLENINTMKEMEFPRDQIVTDLKTLMKTRTITKDEVGKLLDRIGSRSGDVEYIDSVRDEFSKCMDPIEKQIKALKIHYARN